MERIELPDWGWAEIDPDCGGTVRSLYLVPAEDAAAQPVPVLQPAGAMGNPSHAFAGHVMVPFCDRVVGARYTFEDREYELPVNDAERGDAIHGLLHNVRLSVGKHALTTGRRSVVLQGTLPAQAGYPWSLDVRIHYRLTRNRFRIQIRLTNLSETTAPISFGWHPYFVLPSICDEDGTATGTVDGLQLTLPCARVWETDGWGVPTGAPVDVQGSSLDFRYGRTLGNAALDHCFNDAGSALETAARLTDGVHVLSIFARGAMNRFQLYIPPDRRSIAVEPVSAAPDAFRRAELGLRTLAPGAEITGSAEVFLQAPGLRHA